MSLPPQALRRLMREITELKSSPPEGIRIVTPEDNMLDLIGIVQGPAGTPYEGGYFRVRFKFTEEFPAAPPKCWFATKIFHPNVSSSGEICVNTLKKDWSSKYGIGHILVTIKCLLIYPNPESALDEEAGKLLLEDYNRYCERAKLITSVHATPKTRPVEFDIVKDNAEESASTTSPTGSTSTSTTSTSTTLNIPSPTVTVAPTSPYPLKSSPSNTHTITPIVSSASKAVSATAVSSANSKEPERHTSPSPLGTADANVTGGGATAGGPSARRMAGAADSEAAAMGMSKAVKRSAANGAATGAEKRKKALKRL